LAPHPSRAIEAPRAPRAHWNPITRRKNRYGSSRVTKWERGAGQNCAVLCFRARPAGEKCAMWIRASADPQRYARDLYSNLRALDASGCDEISGREPPASAEWSAVRDRLARARSA